MDAETSLGVTMRNKIATVLALVLLTFSVGCANTPPVKKLADDYEILRGKLAAEPSLEYGNKRLFIYLSVASEVEGEKPEIFVCLAFNKERERILVETKENLLKAINEPVFIYATRQDGAFEEIIDGVDYYVAAVGYYMPSAQKYRIIQVGYGMSLRHALRSLKWSDFVNLIGKTALKAVKP
jgi:hypothetical protein